MAKTKSELIEEAASKGLQVSSKTTIKEIEAALASSNNETNSTGADDKSQAKAGKRSAKAQAEAKAKEAKQERKRSPDTEEAKTSAVQKPARSRAERRGKLYKKSMEKLDPAKYYTLAEAIQLAKETSFVKFDATVELHINLAVDPRHADQNVRDNLVLPNGTGKTIRVAALSDDEAAAKAAGADLFNADQIFGSLDKGNIDFDILIASPSQMPKLGKYARTLGPRGLMPNPKSGTVSNDINKAVSEAKAGRIEYRVDSTGIVHVGVGKVSFDDAKLNENIEAVFTSIKANKPASVKGSYIKAIHLSTTMGPSLSVELSALN
ncbi:MAG TPA: 50S ribosomal protein L1 [Candidatus Saccharimonadales bacterium]|nr:50S ribosomal protein L1 [Candidatus Saccharimonadales bacterium]